MGQRIVDVIAARLEEGSLVPYLGPELLRAPPFPSGPRALARWLAERGAVPARFAGDLLGGAQFLEQHGQGPVLLKLLREAFSRRADPSPLHLLLAGLPALPLVVHTWYDTTFFELLAGQVGCRRSTLVHAVSRRERPGAWFERVAPDPVDDPAALDTVVYHPHGTAHPAPAFLATDADYADTLTALEAEAPIPPEVLERRDGRGFLFVGCRFGEALDRIFAHQIMRRSSGPHFAVLADEPGRFEGRFLGAEAVTRLPLSIERFVAELSRALAARLGSAFPASVH